MKTMLISKSLDDTDHRNPLTIVYDESKIPGLKGSYLFENCPCLYSHSDLDKELTHNSHHCKATHLFIEQFEKYLHDTIGCDKTFFRLFGTYVPDTEYFELTPTIHGAQHVLIIGVKKYNTFMKYDTDFKLTEYELLHKEVTRHRTFTMYRRCEYGYDGTLIAGIIERLNCSRV